ncbi:hypothetical protein HELRODRAFT_144193, partial [Helobdella robusta]|uniref:Exonuclease domain-containing protein n=1 Tax=Helobdella robusta TaxID=6412 RepID=T1EJD8_HELRO
CEILEIAAVYMNLSFKRYILPRKAISPSASALNNLTFDGQYLYYKTKQVDAIPCVQALKEFLVFLHQVSKIMNNSYIFLAAHNGDHFDFKHLFRTFREVNLIDAALAIVYGCLDSLLFLRELYPKLLSHKQEDLVKNFLGLEYTAHNALDDAKFLQRLL